MANRKYNRTRESLFYRLRRATVVALGPLIYFTLSLAPWFEGTLGIDSTKTWRELHSWENSWLPNIEKLAIFNAESVHSEELAKQETINKAETVVKKSITQFMGGLSRFWKFPGFRKSKVYQAGRLELRLNLQIIARNQGYRSTELYVDGGLGLHWNAEHPLLLTMADGSQLKALPLGHRQLENGFVLRFPLNMQLVFRSTTQNDATLKLIWPENQALPQKIALPLTREKTKGTQDGGNTQVRYTGAQIQVTFSKEQEPIEQYFSVLDQSRFTKQGYIEIPVQYYRSLNTQVDAVSIMGHASSHIALPLLWQAPQTERSAAYELYNRVYRSYSENLLRTMQQNLAAGQIPASGYSEWLSLYLEMVLEPGLNNEASDGYAAARTQVEAVLQENGWAAGLPLSPYLGIERGPLEASIRADYAIMDEVQRNYELADWSFDGLTGIGNMLFRYGRLNVLRSVSQRAANMRQNQNMSEKRRFYLLHFLWELSQIYPRNGIVNREAIRSEFSALLLRISEQPDTLQDIPYALNVLKILWNSNLQIQESAYSLALKLFQLMDEQGNLGNLGNAPNTQNTIPYFRAFHFMGPQLREHPQNISVVPGFWLWTAGDAKASFRAGQPIEMSTENFAADEGSKLLLLRGVYFYPLDVLIDGKIVAPANRIPRPQTGQASWYYDVGNRLLAITIPASKQERTRLRIR